MGRVAPVCIADKCEALGPLGFSVSGKEDSGDTTEPLEEVPDLLLFCQLADLFIGRKKTLDE